MADDPLSSYALSPTGQRVMDILFRQGSGYGREQLLLLALRFACRFVRPEALEGREPYPDTVAGPVGDRLLLTFLRMAEKELADE